MALRIELPTGQVMLIDELTGDIVGMEQPNPPPYDPLEPGKGRTGTPAGPTTSGSGALPPPPGVGVGATTTAPPGYIWVQDPIDGTLKLVTDRTFQGDNTLSPNTVYSQQQQNARDEANRAEQIRQFNEQFVVDKDKYNTTFNEGKRQFNERLGLDREQLDVRRGETLLNLGSRPDTLIRYLHALRGQQAPQGLGTPPALPGFPGTAAYPTPGAGAPTGAPGTQRLGPPTEYVSGTGGLPDTSGKERLMGDRQRALPVAESGQMIGLGQSAIIPAGQSVRTPSGSASIGGGGGTISVAQGPGSYEQAGALPPEIRAALDAERAKQGATGNAAPPIVNPMNLSPTLKPIAQSVQFAPSQTQFAGPSVSESDALDQIRSREQYNAAQRAQGGTEARKLQYDPSVGRLYAEGGVIPEPVMGMGMDSGQTYMLGEESHKGVREVVVPEDKVPKDIFERLMKDAEEVDYSEDKTGKRHVKVKRNSFAEGGPLGYKPIDPKVFNPPAISNDFNFPQIGNLTGGTSLVPSAQRLFESLPSERALYSGYLRDEVGVQSEDVFEMARRLAPKATGLSAGRFVN